MSAGVQTRASGPSGILPGLLAIGVLIGGMLLLSGGREVQINNSGPGFRGLAIWLQAEGISARMITSTNTREQASEIGLRILALHDSDLIKSAAEAETEIERLGQPTERDIRVWVISRKLKSIPTLVILPKWRAGVRLLGVTHPELLLPPRAVERVARQVVGARMQLAPPPQSLADSNGRQVELEHPHLLGGADCEPLIGTRDAVLLGACKTTGGASFWLLTDPDLMNNMGLSHGQNADITRDLIVELSGGRDVVIDTTTRVWASRTSLGDPGRSWSELARFFAFPFSVVWISMLVLMLLIFWRAWLRNGPALTRAEEAHGDEARAEVALSSKAGLMRLGGHDAALVRDYVAGRLDAMAVRLLGPHSGTGPAAQAALIRMAESRETGLAEELRALSAEPAGDITGSGDFMSRIARLHALEERLLDGSRRPRNTG